MTRLVVLVGTLLAVLAGAASASAAAWRPHPLPPPPGGSFSVPVGSVGDIAFWAPNRGLMTVAGNASVKPGLYSWDGQSWHQLSTVCGGGANARIAWAGPREFWVITAPSIGTPTSGQGLCRFKDGAVVASYSFYNLPEFEEGLTVNAAACRTADDCWFGGVGGRDSSGSRVGAFHLHWDGTSLRSVYNGQGRGVSDVVAHRGGLIESTYVGPRAGAQGARASLRVAEPTPLLLHRIEGEAFPAEPFTPTPRDDVPVDGTEIRGLGSDGTTAWAVGGGAGSGPSTFAGYVQRTPFAARKSGDGPWTELDVAGDLPAGFWFGGVAPDPGTAEAWASVTQIEGSGDGTSIAGDSSKPTVARIAADGTATVEELDPSGRTGDGARGSTTALACAAPGDCWAATAKGYLYRTSGAIYERDTDPAFQGTIAVRPNEAAAQVVPDAPPTDDSRQFAPPVILPDPLVEVAPEVCDPPSALVSRVRATRAPLTRRQRAQRDPRLTIRITFRLARRARVGLTARRGKKVVARVKARTLRAGTRRLTFPARRRTYPKSLRFALRELQTPSCGATDDGGDAGNAVATRSLAGATR